MEDEILAEASDAPLIHNLMIKAFMNIKMKYPLQVP